MNKHFLKYTPIHGKTMSYYNFVILSPAGLCARRPELTDANEKVFLNPVLGIEVTEPLLASRCLFGNIDPEHGETPTDIAAILVALTFPLPPEGTTLATIKPDVDSVGSMAVLILRAEDHQWTDSQIDRIHIIARTEINTTTPEWQPRDLTIKGLEDSFRNRPLAGIAGAIANRELILEERVELMKTWILTGQEPAGYRENYENQQRVMAMAIELGDIVITPYDKFVVVVSTHRSVTTVGYASKPVVVAYNPNDGRYTICQYGEAGRYLDIKSLKLALNTHEVGWGGGPTIVCSPQGVPSTLSIETVIKTLEPHLV
jgi:hypothetical protein